MVNGRWKWKFQSNSCQNYWQPLRELGKRVRMLKDCSDDLFKIRMRSGGSLFKCIFCLLKKNLVHSRLSVGLCVRTGTPLDEAKRCTFMSKKPKRHSYKMRVARFEQNTSTIWNLLKILWVLPRKRLFPHLPACLGNLYRHEYIRTSAQIVT